MRANREQNHLQGSVRAIHARTVTLVERDGQTVEHLQSTRTITWDTAGHRVEETSQYRSDGTLICNSRHTYDSTGNLTELVAYNTDGSVALKKVYAYDSTGRLIEEKNYSADGSLMGSRHPTYTAEGWRIEEMPSPFPEYKPDVGYIMGVEGTDICIGIRDVHRIRKVYDGAGNLREMTLRRQNGSLAGKVLLTYDDEGRVTEVVHYGRTRAGFCGPVSTWQRLLTPLMQHLVNLCLLLKCLYSYGIRGEWQKATHCLAYGPPLIQVTFVYNAKGQKVEERQSLVGFVVRKKVLTYDAQGHTSEETEYEADGSIVHKQTYTREYDAQGNWIKETIFAYINSSGQEKPREATVVTYRTISYDWSPDMS